MHADSPDQCKRALGSMADRVQPDQEQVSLQNRSWFGDDGAKAAFVRNCLDHIMVLYNEQQSLPPPVDPGAHKAFDDLIEHNFDLIFSIGNLTLLSWWNILEVGLPHVLARTGLKHGMAILTLYARHLFKLARQSGPAAVSGSISAEVAAEMLRAKLDFTMPPTTAGVSGLDHVSGELMSCTCDQR